MTMTDDQIMTLLKGFAPMVILHTDEEHRPIQVETFVNGCSMHYTTWGPDKKVVDQVTTTNITQQQYDGKSSSYTKTHEATNFYLRLKDDGTSQGVSKDKIDTVPFYGNAYPTTETDGKAGHCDLIYGFFYAYDNSNAGLANAPAAGAAAGGAVGTAAGPVGTAVGTGVGWVAGKGAQYWAPHEGDWEHVIVRIGKDADGDYSTSSPVLAVYFQAHGQGDPYSKWYYPPESSNPDKFEWKSEEHKRRVRVFSALGSHASYPTNQRWSYFALRPDDDTNWGVHWQAAEQDDEPKIELITSDSPSWNDFNGHFGDCMAPRPAAGPNSPAVQGWLKVDSRPGGPDSSTPVTVAPTTSFPGAETPRHSADFKLDFPGRVTWTVETNLSADLIAHLSFDIVAGDAKLVHSIKNGMMVEQGYQRGNVRVADVTVTTSAGTYSGDEVFTHLGIEHLILRVADAS